MSKKVFVSSRLNGELDRERGISLSVISGMGLEPILWEKEASLAEHNQRWWRQQIDESGLLILLLSSSISPPVYDEFATAIGLNKKLVVFCKDINLITQRKLILSNWETEESSSVALDWLYTWLAEHRINIIESDASFTIALRDAVADALEFKETLSRHYLIDTNEINRIRSVYVPPSNYHQAESILAEKRLLLLLGSPHIGKTATAIFLLAELFKTKKLRSLITCSSRSDLAYISDIRNAGILLDDAFGKVIFDEECSGIESQAILSLAENNYVVITSRAEVFSEGLAYTRFGEVSLESHCVHLEQEGSYDDEQLGQILENHVRFALDRDIITLEQADIIKRQWALILKGLRFPHNIERFAMVHLNQVKRPRDVEIALKKSKEIEHASGQWYRRLSTEQKAIVVSLAICGFEDWNQFNTCTATAASLLGIQMRDISTELPQMSGYIRVGDKLAFSHPSYHVGIIGEIAYRDYAIVKQLLLEGKDCREGRILLGLALREMAEKHPNIVLTLAPALAMRPGRVKKHAIIALGRIDKTKSREAIPLLKDISVTGGSVHRRRAVRSLGHYIEIEPELVCDAILPLLDDPAHLVRLNIARVFSDKYSVVPSTAFSILSSLIADTNAKVRKQAMIGLNKLVWQFPDEAYHVLDSLPEHAITPKIRWFANNFCLQYEKKKGLVKEFNKRMRKLEQDSHIYIQRKLQQIQ